MHALPQPIAYHLVPAEAWASAPPDEPFRPASLASEGFVHLTHWMTDLIEVANDLYRADPRPHLVLTVVLDWLTSPWRYDGDQRYPHVYGPLDRAAIAEVRPIERDADGRFLPIERAAAAAVADGGVARPPGWPVDSAHVEPTEPDDEAFERGSGAGAAYTEPREPDDEAFEAMVFDALDALPEAFRSRLGSVAVVIEDEASSEQLATVHAAGLYGLYQGVPRTALSADQAPVPSKITIFRRPHLQRYGIGPGLAAGVGATVRHEVAHHFGISDQRLHELERD